MNMTEGWYIRDEYAPEPEPVLGSLAWVPGLRDVSGVPLLRRVWWRFLREIRRFL